MRAIVAGIAAAVVLSACTSTDTTGEIGTGVSRSNVATIAGRPVEVFTLTNINGLKLRAMTWGATIIELHVPDRDGNLDDVVLALADLTEYPTKSDYFGCVAGRYANRIENGRFTLDGTEHQLTINNNGHHLHGGVTGFDKQHWSGRLVADPRGPAVRFTLVSPAGDQGYPGTLTTNVTYILTNDNRFITEFNANTTAPTIVNLAQHNYWNLAGHASGTINDHLLTIHASRYTPVDATLIPTGELAPVDGTPFDFTTPKPIGRDLLATGGDPAGYDHNFVVEGDHFTMRPVARLEHPGSGRVMLLSGDQPGVQFYGGGFLNGTLVGKGGTLYQQYGGLCLETQVFPNSINEPAWPQPVLRPGETYRHTMITTFTTDTESKG